MKTKDKSLDDELKMWKLHCQYSQYPPYDVMVQYTWCVSNDYDWRFSCQHGVILAVCDWLFFVRLKLLKYSGSLDQHGAIQWSYKDK